MQIAIMQPTYLPWIGYFALINEVDKFVLLDDVQFDYRSWQHKNKINSPQGEILLTVPVFTKGRKEQLISDVEIDYSKNWQKKHITAIQFNYGKSPYFNEYFPDIKRLILDSPQKLVRLNIEIIKYFKNVLNISTPLVFSSELNLSGGKVHKLINICKNVNATEYLSPQGSFSYIDENNIFGKENISLRYFNYEHPNYNTNQKSFVSYLSIIDLMLNEGLRSKEIIKSGVRASLTHSQIKHP